MYKSDSVFFALVKDFEKGLSSRTYQLRRKVLSEYFDLQKSPVDKLQYLDCNIEIGWMADKLFMNHPSISTTSYTVCTYKAKRAVYSLHMFDKDLSSIETFLIQYCTDFETEGYCPEC